MCVCVCVCVCVSVYVLRCLSIYACLCKHMMDRGKTREGRRRGGTEHKKRDWAEEAKQRGKGGGGERVQEGEKWGGCGRERG